MNKPKLVWRVYLLALHAVVLVLLFKSGVLAAAAVKLGLRSAPTPAGLTWMREMHRQMDPQVPNGSIVFLGDSITFRLVPAAVTPNGVNFGVSGTRSDHLLKAIDGYQSLERARHAVVTIGTNDVLEGKHHGIEERYRAILKKIPRHVAVLMSSIPPLEAPHLRERALHAVRSARAACAADPRCHFLDAHAALSANGAPLPGVLLDGVHLSPEGYGRWITLLKGALAPAAPEGGGKSG